MAQDSVVCAVAFASSFLSLSGSLAAVCETDVPAELLLFPAAAIKRNVKCTAEALLFIFRQVQSFSEEMTFLPLVSLFFFWCGIKGSISSLSRSDV